MSGFVARNNILTALWVCFIACSGSTEKRGQMPETLLEADAYTPVKTIVCKKQPFIYQLKFEGKIKALREQVWIAENAGVIKDFSGYSGRRYGAGEVIAVLDQYQIRLKLERAMLAKFNAQREYESLLLGYTSLLEGRPAWETDTIKKKLRISSGLAYAEQDIKDAQAQLGHAQINAPFAGILADVSMQKGNHFNAGDKLFTLYADRELVLETDVLETDLMQVKQGVMAKVIPVSVNDIVFDAVVERINPYVNDKGMVNVQLKITNQGTNKSMLFPGMHCTAVLDAKTTEGIVVPKTALVKRNGKLVVFTVQKGTAKWNDVTVGDDDGKYVLVSQGLNIGDHAIVSDNNQLTNLSPVKEEQVN